jgi:hypothetical protein
VSRIRTIALEKKVEELEAEVERLATVCDFLSSAILNIHELIARQEENKDD